MTLREARIMFTRLKAELILWVNQEMGPQGYGIASGEGMDRLTEKDSTSDHMKGSLHNVGLAEDEDLYKDGKYVCYEGPSCKNSLHDPLDRGHDQIGAKWESMHQNCKWGGRFKDPNHYSFAPKELVGNRK